MADEDDVCSFYGAVVTSGGKGTEIKVKPGRVLLLKQAALAKPAGPTDRVTLSVKCDGQELVVCSLTQSCEQVCIDLAFGPANKATLVLKGSPGCAVHICGAPPPPAPRGPISGVLEGGHLPLAYSPLVSPAIPAVLPCARRLRDAEGLLPVRGHGRDGGG